MIKERHCSYEVARLLKEKGFRECCRYCYGTAVRHNGEDIDEDEEFELKSEGRADEIEYIKGGILHKLYCDNAKSFGKDLCATPTHQMALDWLREVHKIFIKIPVSLDLNGDYHYSYSILDKNCKYIRKGYTSLDWTFENTVEEALKYVLENLI